MKFEEMFQEPAGGNDACGSIDCELYRAGCSIVAANPYECFINPSGKLRCDIDNALGFV